MLTKEELKIRQSGIGGSDAAKVCNVSHYANAFDVYQQKLGLASPQEMTDAMKVGVAMEPVILDKYEEITGNRVKRDFAPMFSRKHSFMLATLDGMVTDKNIIVEAKTARNRREWGTTGTCDIPIDYLFQVAHYCAVYNVPQAHIITYFKFQQTYDLFIYDRNERLEEALIQKEKAFWENHIIARVPPAITSLKQARTVFDFANDDVTAVAVEEIEEKLRHYRRIEERKKQLMQKQEELKIDLMLAMGVASKLVDEFGVNLATWKNVESNRFDSASFKKDHPDLFKQYTTKQHTRRFLPNYKYGEN